MEPPPKPKLDKAQEPKTHVKELIHNRFFSPLVSFFKRRGYQTSEAEDGAQEVFVRLSGLESQQQIDNPKAYLFRVAASVISDRARKAQVRHENMHVSIDNFDIGGVEPSSERVLIIREELSHLLKALDTMPTRRREMLLLNRLDGLSYSQLAVRYGISISGVEKQMMKAIAHINEVCSANSGDL
jgi:RNA polymerase sigma factor (sigma-70 family)